jgi:hypothetical protein
VNSDSKGNDERRVVLKQAASYMDSLGSCCIHHGLEDSGKSSVSAVACSPPLLSFLY